MAHGQVFSNNAVALLDVSIGPTDTTIVVQPGLGALFPAPGPSEWFLVTLEDITSPLVREIIRVNGRSGDVLTVAARGHEGTTAQSWLAGQTLVDHRLTAGTLNDLAHQSGGGGNADPRVYDAGFALTNTASTTILTLNQTYAAGSTAVYVGGLRQKRGTDYTESSAQQVTLNYVVSPADVAAGQNIVVDFTPD